MIYIFFLLNYQKNIDSFFTIFKLFHKFILFQFANAFSRGNALYYIKLYRSQFYVCIKEVYYTLFQYKTDINDL